MRSLTPCWPVSAAERLRIEPLHLGKRKGGLRGAGVLDDGLELGIERLPCLERDDAFAGAVRLVEARRVIERRHPVEPERDVGAGADEFGAVDRPDCMLVRISPGEVVCGVAPSRR